METSAPGEKDLQSVFWQRFSSYSLGSIHFAGLKYSSSVTLQAYAAEWMY